jgi:hypothetical protein
MVVGLAVQNAIWKCRQDPLNQALARTPTSEVLEVVDACFDGAAACQLWQPPMFERMNR